MRLAYLCTDPGIAFGGTKGAAVHVGEVVEALANRGVEVLLLVARAEPKARCPERVTLEVLPEPGAGELEGRLRDFRAEALYERLALFSDAGGAAARAARIPHLVELNAPLLEEAARYRELGESPLADRLERTVLGGADVVLAVSRPLASYARERGASRVEVVPNGVALERFPRAAIHSDRDPVAILVGSLRPWHGVETVAAAWRLLGSSAPRLVVLGDGRRGGELAAVGAETLGPVPHEAVPPALAAADIGLVPYGRDAPNYFSPLKLFEYMAAGLAVVAATIPGVTDIVRAGDVRLVPPGDPERLARAVSDLAATPEVRRRMGTAARERVASAHTWGHRARRIATVAAALAARTEARV